MAPQRMAADSTWNGSGANASWVTTGNWQNNTLPGSATGGTAEFFAAIGSGSNGIILGNSGIAQVIFEAGGAAFTFTSGTLSLGQSGFGINVEDGNASNETFTNTSTIQIGLGGGGVGTFLFNNTNTAGQGQLIVNGNVTGVSAETGTSTLVLEGAGGGQVNGSISNGTNSGEVVAVNTTSGTWTLSGANTYTGSTSISGATLRLTSTNAIADSVLVMNNLSILQLRADAGSTFNTAGITLSGGSAYTIDVNNLTAGNTGNTLNLSGAVTFAGATTLGITGSNNYTLGLGSVTLGGADAFNPTTASVTIGSIATAGNTLTLTGSDNGTITGAISGAGGITVSGTGSDWTLSSGNSTYSGNTTLGPGSTVTGTLAFGASSTLTSGTISSGPIGTGTLLLSSGGVFMATGGARTVANNMDTTGDGSFAIGGTSALTMSGTFFYNNTTTLTVSNTALTTFSGPWAGTSGATFKFAGPGNVTLSGNIGTSIPLTYEGTGTFDLSGSNAYNGASNFQLGTTVLDASSNAAASLAGGAINVAVSGTSITGGNATLLVKGNYLIGNAGSPTLTIIGGNGTTAGQGTLSLVDGTVNTLTIHSAAAGANVLTLGANSILDFEVGSSADEILLGSGLKTTVNGTVLVNIIGLGSLNGQTQILLSTANTSAFTIGSGNNFVLSGTSGNIGSYSLALSAGSGATIGDLLLTETLVGAPTPTTAYWDGSVSNAWNAITGSNAGTNWSSAASSGTDTHQIPGSITNVFFSVAGGGSNSTTLLGANFTINSLTFTSDASGANDATIGGTNTLTITPGGTNGITVNSGAGAETISSTLALGASQIWAVNNSPSTPLTIGGVVTGGASSLTITGTGKVVFTGSNTYTGTTTISGSSTLALGNGSSNGYVSGNILDNSSLVYNAAGLQSFSNSISGSGSVTVTSGTEALTGSNSYGGVTIVSGGVLAVGNVNALGNTSSLSVSSAGAVNFSTGTPHTYALSGASGATLTLANGDTLTFGVGSGTADALDLQAGATASVSGTTTIDVVVSGTGVNSWTLISAPGGGLNSGTFVLGTLPSLTSGSLTESSTALTLTVATINTVYWKGGTSNSWVTGSSSINFTSDQAGNTVLNGTFGPGQDVIFSATGAANQSTVLGGNVSAHSLTINDGTPVTVGGTGTLTLSGSTGTTGINTGNGAGAALISANVTLAGTPNVTVNNSAGLTISGTIGSSNGLAVNGANTLTLTGSQAYTGVTTVSSSSTLQLGNGSADGTIVSGSIANAGVLVFNNVNNKGYSGNIGGAGSVAIKGAGAETLGGAASGYTGATQIAAGSTLRVGSVGALGNTAALSLGNGAALDFSLTGTTHTYTLSGATGATLTLNNATITLDVGSGTADEIVLQNGATASVTGTETIDVSALPGVGVTSYTIISAPGGGLSSGSFVLGGTPPPQFTTTLTDSGTALILTYNPISTGTAFWKGSGTSPGYWSDYTNFTSDAAGTQPLGSQISGSLAVVFSGSGAINQSPSFLDYNATAKSLIINDPAGVDISTFGGYTLNLTGTGNSTGITVGSAAGALQAEIDAKINLSGTSNITVNNTGGLLITGAISGSNGITINGTGMLTLTGLNTYTGGAQLVSGTLNADLDNNFGATGTGNGVTFNPGAGKSVTLQSGGSGWTTSNNRTFAFASGTGIIDPGVAGNIMTIAGPVAGTAVLEVVDTGELVLSGSVAFNGTAIVSSGTLELKLPGTLGQTGASVFGTAPGATLILDNSTVQNLAPTAGSVTFSGNGTLLVAGGTTLQMHNAGGGNINMNMTSGTIEISGGILENGGSGGNGTPGDPAQANGSPTWTNNMASLQIDAGASFDPWDGNAAIFDALLGSGSIYRSGYGAGFNAVVTIGINNGSGVFSGSIQDGFGTTAITKTGTGTETFSGNNTYTGATIINGGKLKITNNNGLGFGGGTYVQQPASTLLP